MVALIETDADDNQLCDATEGTLWLAWSTLGLGPRSSFRRLHRALAVETSVKSLPYYFVQHMTDEGDLPGQVARVFEHCAGRGTPFIWMTGPSTAPGVEKLPAEHGFVSLEAIPGMAAPLAPFSDGPPPKVVG